MNVSHALKTLFSAIFQPVDNLHVEEDFRFGPLAYPPVLSELDDALHGLTADFDG